MQWKFSGQTLFSGQAQAVKNPKRKKYMKYSEKFQGNCFFQGKRKLLKNRERWKNFQYSLYIQLGVIHVIWASVVWL